jgi:hypothetical protein
LLQQQQQEQEQQQQQAWHRHVDESEGCGRGLQSRTHSVAYASILAWSARGLLRPCVHVVVMSRPWQLVWGLGFFCGAWLSGIACSVCC